MATYTIKGAISKINGYLDKVADEARGYMSDYIRENATKGYATGSLADSIDIVKASENSRSVGSSLRSDSSHKVYGHYVDKGRGAISGKRMKFWDPFEGRWVYTTHVKGMEGINFVEATKKHLESTNIPL